MRQIINENCDGKITIQPTSAVQASQINIFHHDLNIPVAAFIIGAGNFNVAFGWQKELFAACIGCFVELIIDIPIHTAHIVTRFTNEL